MATGRVPSSWAERKNRMAISLRLATRSFLNGRGEGRASAGMERSRREGYPGAELSSFLCTVEAGDRAAGDVDRAHAEVAVEDDEVGLFARREAAELLSNA